MYDRWEERFYDLVLSDALNTEVLQIAQFCTVLELCCIAAPYTVGDAIVPCMSGCDERCKYGLLRNTSAEQAMKLKESCPNVKV